MVLDFKSIESRWKKIWKESELYKVSHKSDKPKFYVLDMFPYPSGAGLHVGHPLGYIASDIVARYKRLKGFNVLHPMGFDAFGLPAEEYAVATGVHPAKSTADNIVRYKEQLANIGFSFDWSREVQTCDPKYYKWTQWIFTLLFDHYYDLEADKAKPISELISTFETSGSSSVMAYTLYEGAFTADDWTSMSETNRFEILSEYRLAYRKVGYVNWCSALGTVLANDQIKDGLSERGGHPVEKKAMTQWYLRTTAYAERLLSGLEEIDWSASLKTIQRNWIGKSTGAQLHFEIDGYTERIEVFTTRPDTIFGATYMVLAPEHPLTEKIISTDQYEEVAKYLKYVSSRSDRERMSQVKQVTGVFTGAYALNPFTQKKIPIWIGEYVLMDYGTGAIMAVPSDDERDYTFAEKFGLEIIPVVDKSAYPNASKSDKVGVMINSKFLNGLEVTDAIKRMQEEIESKRLGVLSVNYKMRDAGFSRQRYWGEPFPILYKNGIPTVLKQEQLPLELPQTADFKPTSDGQSPLSRIDSWVNAGTGITRETDTMPAVAGSSWYFLRYMDPNNEEVFASQEALDYWQDVDLYVGGSEHAVAHLLYARFWHKFLFDLGYVSVAEPFKKLINQGMIQGVIESIAFIKGADGNKDRFVSADKVKADEVSAFIPVHIKFVSDYGSEHSHLNQDGIQKFLEWRPDYSGAEFETSDEGKLYTKSETGKMSKRYYNVVNPDDVVEAYGADTFRLYEMFLGPIEQSKPWDMQGIEGVAKFLRRFWNLYYKDDNFSVSEDKASPEELRILHTAIKKVGEDIERFSHNTAISALMICVNELKKSNCNKREILEPLAQLLAPIAPFTTEELWAQLGHSESIHTSKFPVLDENHLKENSFEYPICVNGKKRASKSFPADADKTTLEKEALAMEEMKKWIEGKNVVKVIVVPQRMVNIVVK